MIEKKLPVSKFDKDYDWVNDCLKKILFDKIDLDESEISMLEYFLDKFVKTDCDYDGVCLCRDVGACKFSGIPDDWVKLSGFDNLCDLILNYILNDRQLKKTE